MSFIQKALSYGYDADTILKTIAQHNPEFAERLQSALQYGYGADRLLNDFMRSWQGPQSKKTARAMGIRPQHVKNLVFEESFDPAVSIPRALSPRARGEESPAEKLGRVARPLAAAGAGLAAGAALGPMAGGVAETVVDRLGGMLSESEDQVDQAAPEQPQERQFDALQYISGMFGPESLPGAMKMLKGLEPQPMLLYLRTQFGSDAIRKMKRDTGLNPLDIARMAKEQLDTVEMSEERGPEGPAFDLNAEQQLRAQREQELRIPQEEATSFPELDALRDESIGQFWQGLKEATPLQAQRLRAVQALPSSNVRRVNYDDETGLMQVLFAKQPGTKRQQLYEFPVEHERFEAVADAEGIPVTRGASAYGWWSQDKMKSHGAAFNNMVKKLFPVAADEQKISVKDVSDADMRLIHDADRAWSAARVVEGFDRLQKRPKAREQIDKFEFNKLFKDLDDPELEQAMIDVIIELKEKGKRLTKKAVTETLREKVNEPTREGPRGLARQVSPVQRRQSRAPT